MEENQEAVMGVVDHIREFRNRLFVIIAVFVVALLVCFNYAAPIVDVLKIPAGEMYQFVYIAPAEIMMQYVKLALIGGLVLASPVILYELLAFASPGLKTSEKTFTMGVLILGFFFFVLGVMFAFYIMLPFMLEFFFNINTNADISAQISLENYLSFMLKILGMMGLVFEIPVVTILLTQMGFLKPEWMRKGRRVIIVLVFIVAAIITPPDVVSQCMTAIPMLILFEISIFFSGFIVKRKAKVAAKKKSKDEEYKYQ